MYMIGLPLPVLFIIWQFAGPKAIYLNKQVGDYAAIYKKTFKETPLVVYYQLQRLKEKVSAKRAHTWQQGQQRRPRHRVSICVEPACEISLKGPLPLGYLLEGGKVKYSKELKDSLVPASVLRYSSFFDDSYKVTYWEIDKVWVKDLQRARMYCCLFGFC